MIKYEDMYSATNPVHAAVATIYKNITIVRNNIFLRFIK